MHKAIDYHILQTLFFVESAGLGHLDRAIAARDRGVESVGKFASKPLHK